MLLGYQRRSAGRLLATASWTSTCGRSCRAAVRRGGWKSRRRRGDEENGAIVHCGVFSPLDRMSGEPPKFWPTVPAKRALQALVENTGPYQPYLAMVKAAEGESVYDYREAAEQLLMSVAEINRAQLRALMGAGVLE